MKTIPAPAGALLKGMMNVRHILFEEIMNDGLKKVIVCMAYVGEHGAIKFYFAVKQEKVDVSNWIMSDFVQLKPMDVKVSPMTTAILSKTYKKGSIQISYSSLLGYAPFCVDCCLPTGVRLLRILQEEGAEAVWKAIEKVYEQRIVQMV